MTRSAIAQAQRILAEARALQGAVVDAAVGGADWEVARDRAELLEKYARALAAYARAKTRRRD